MTQVHPWIKSYPEGVRWDIEIEPGPVQKILDDAAAKWPERPALDFMGPGDAALADALHHRLRGPPDRLAAKALRVTRATSRRGPMTRIERSF